MSHPMMEWVLDELRRMGVDGESKAFFWSCLRVSFGSVSDYKGHVHALWIGGGAGQEEERAERSFEVSCTAWEDL